MSTTRRTFLAGAAVAMGPCVLQAAEPVYLYGAESFTTFIRDAPFVIAMLVTRRPDTHIQAIREIKKATGYPHVMRYRSNDRKKLGCAREMLHYFVRTPEEDLRFAALVLSPSRPLKGPDLESFRLTQYRRLFRALPNGGVLRVNRFRPKYVNHTWNPQKEFDKRVNPLVAAGLVARGEAIHLRAGDGLLELAQLLSGSLFHEANIRSEGLQIKSRVKSLVADRLRQLLGTDDLRNSVGKRWLVDAG